MGYIIAIAAVKAYWADEKLLDDCIMMIISINFYFMNIAAIFTILTNQSSKLNLKLCFSMFHMFIILERFSETCLAK